jgi:hypothetical protein
VTLAASKSVCGAEAPGHTVPVADPEYVDDFLCTCGVEPDATFWSVLIMARLLAVSTPTSRISTGCGICSSAWQSGFNKRC